MAAWSQTYTFLDGAWFEGNHPFIGARSHAFWLGSSVFDGARAFDGVTPDLDKHCARVNRSAAAMWLRPIVSEEAMIDLVCEELRKFSPGAELYIRPMYWAEHSSAWSSVPPEPELDSFLSLSLRSSPSRQIRDFNHPFAIREASRSDYAYRRQSRLPLPQQQPRPA